MRILLILIIFVVSTSYAGSKINNFRLKDLNNKMTSFAKVKGEKFTILDFWATWCKPCLKAIPKLNEIQNAYTEKGVNVVGINIDSPRNSAKVKPFAKTYKINYTVLRDPNSDIATQLNVSSYPTLYIINAEYEIVYQHIGFRTGDDKLIVEELDKLLRKKDAEKN